MKKILLFITLISFGITKAQIVNIPDVDLKNKLLSADTTNSIAKDINGFAMVIDINQDNEIQYSEALNVYELELDGNSFGFSDITGIEAFTNLTHLNCKNNHLSSLYLSNLTNLTELICSNVYSLSNLDLSNQTNLTYLNCSRNQLTSLDLSNQTNLTYLNCRENQLTSLDLSNQTNLTYLGCGENQLTSLDLSNQTNLTELICGNNPLGNLDLSNQINLTFLRCYQNQLTSLDLSQINLTYLHCSSNQLTSLDLSNQINLTDFGCYDNQLTSLDLSQINLFELQCGLNQLTNLDLSNQTNLVEIACSNNQNLTFINLKNGNNHNILYNPDTKFYDLPNLQTVCVDELNTDLTAFIESEVGHSITFTENCSITPELSNQINGIIKLDLNDNGCDSSDLSMSNLMLVTNNGTESFATFTQNNGDYLLYTNEGNFTTEITTNLPNYYSANPNLETNTFTGFGNTFTADFCVEPNQTVNDVNINIIPISQARPGFNTTYQIVYKNVGTTQLNDNITLEFDETKLSFLNASETVNSQTSNSLTFNYTNLNPFETRTIDLEFNVFAPPTVEIDDILSFTTTINPIAGDLTTDDNIFTFNQTVIGSYDPNDITCLEGDEILLADANKYLHYLIRFQNTGTASAINVVVTNNLDANLDWSTLQLESLSHNNRVAIKNGNEIEFIFENINLPDSTTDEPNSHGFIAYKIKPKTDIAPGDVIPNKADIFFDFNTLIETNTATTTIVNALAVNENTLLDFSVYPTPTENILNIKSKTEIIKIEIYSKLGQKVKETTENQIDISNLTQGLYFVKVEDANGNFGVKKIVKK